MINLNQTQATKPNQIITKSRQSTKAKTSANQPNPSAFSTSNLSPSTQTQPKPKLSSNTQTKYQPKYTQKRHQRIPSQPIHMSKNNTTGQSFPSLREAD
jgi:hypothetical protein